MFARIFAYCWIVAGSMLFIWPKLFRNRLKRKGLRKLRIIFFFTGLALGAMLISVGLKFHGSLSKAIVIVGVIAIFKGIFLLKSKAAEKISNWFLNHLLSYLTLLS